MSLGIYSVQGSRARAVGLCVCLAAAACSLSGSMAQAQGWGIYNGWGGNLTGLPYNYFQNQQELPYFSKFPPVYYSYPVARTYGYSPFAYPPGTMTPEIEGGPAPPAQIINPYVPQPGAPQPQRPAGPQPRAAAGQADVRCHHHAAAPVGAAATRAKGNHQSLRRSGAVVGRSIVKATATRSQQPNHA